MDASHRGRSTRSDPTRMANQPALRTSDGLIWIVVAGIFLVICAVPLSLLTVVDPRESAPVAWTTALLLVALYGALLAARGYIAERGQRLRMMAGLMLAMAAVALIGMMVCTAIEWGAVPTA